jgi:RND family efflux transporter MFP subunit
LTSSANAYKQLQDYLVLRAPFSGVITNRYVDQGDLVGATGTNGPLLVLERVDILRLRVPVPEEFVSGVPADQEIDFTADAALGKNFGARLSRKSGRIDPVTRTEIWEYEFINSADDLKPGMYAMADLRLNREEPSFIVPFTAVVTTLEKRFIVRVRNGRTEWVDVRQGISMGEGLEVFGDLSEGDTILVRGSEEIRPGTELKIKIE